MFISTYFSIFVINILTSLWLCERKGEEWEGKRFIYFCSFFTSIWVFENFVLMSFPLHLFFANFIGVYVYWVVIVINWNETSRQCSHTKNNANENKKPKLKKKNRNETNCNFHFILYECDCCRCCYHMKLFAIPVLTLLLSLLLYIVLLLLPAFVVGCYSISFLCVCEGFAFDFLQNRHQLRKWSSK